ncbi:MAG: tetratricopeptide repeat protein [Myxococcota bacterium]
MILPRACAVFTLLLAVGCGSHRQAQQAQAVPAANPQAVSRMAEGVEAAKSPNGKERAIGLFEQAVKADSSLWEARYDLGVLYADAGNLAAAERELNQAAQLSPNSEDVVLALAEVRRRRRDPASAIQALESFVKGHPHAALAPIALMTVLREGGKVDAAIDLAHRLLVRRARDPYVLSELALAHLEKGEIDTAEILVQEALKAEPRSAVAERTAGLVALKKGDDALSFKHFAKASDLDPNDTTARLNIGTVLLQAGVYDRAAEQFRAVHDAEPDDVAATLGLAAARRSLAKKDDSAAIAEVEKLLKSVLDKEPDNLAATFNLAVLYADYGKRPTEAAQLFRRFLEQAPPSHPARPEAEKWLSAQSSAAPSAPASAGQPTTPAVSKPVPKPSPKR